MESSGQASTAAFSQRPDQPAAEAPASIVRGKDQFTMDQQGANHLLEQSFDLWFRPEIERRKSFGLLAKNFSVWAGQVIMDLEIEKPLIRLNEEVHGFFRMKAASPLNYKIGEVVHLNDFESIQEMSLANEFPNAGHLTAMLHKKRWYIIFDFQYNGGRIETQLSSADQFLEASRFCIESNLPIPAIDNLYDAVQLMAKCFLLVMPDKQILEATSHGFIETKFNLHGKLGNVSSSSVRLLNRLAQLRPKTRYAAEPIQISQTELKQLFESGKQMRSEIESRRPKRKKIPAPAR